MSAPPGADAVVFLTIQEAAARLSIGKRTLHRFIAEGRVPLYRINDSAKLMRVKASDVDALAKEVPTFHY